MRRVRTVITGVRSDGRSAALMADVPALRSPAPADWHGVWGWDEPPPLPLPLPPDAPPESVFPPAGGVRVATVVCPPGLGTTLAPLPAGDPSTAGFARRYAAVPTGGAHDERSAVHDTATVDVVFLIAGEIELELEAETVALRQGDVVVQHGTVHAWRNRGAEACVLGIVNLRAA